MPCLCKLTDKVRLQTRELYKSIRLPCASTEAIWRQLNPTALLRKTKSLSENAVVSIIHLLKVVLHFQPQVRSKQVRTSSGNPKTFGKTIDR